MLARVLPRLISQPAYLVLAQPLLWASKGTLLHHNQFSSQRDQFPLQAATLNGSRGVLRLAGDDTIHFLQGLVTNNVSPLTLPGAQPLYACLLNAQGRFLYDMFLHSKGGEDGAVLADVDADSMPEVVKLLKRYRLRAKVDIAVVSDEYQSHVLFGRPHTAAEGPWQADPRTPVLGWRALCHGDAPPPAPPGAPSGSVTAYQQWRIEHGVAEGPLEIPTGQAVPLEYNIDGLHGICFSKGCYVGQELMARSHFQGTVRKRVMPARVHQEDGTPGNGARVPEAGADIFDEGNRKRPIGKVLVAAGDRLLAHIRLKPALDAMEANRALRIGDSGLSVKPWRPCWWPPLWGHEEGAAEAVSA